MTKNTTTLDERIRAKALKALEDRITESSRPLRRELGNCLNTVISGVYDKNGEMLQAGAALHKIVSAIIAAQAANEQDKAVQNFINKVDGLQDQLDELSNHIDN